MRVGFVKAERRSGSAIMRRCEKADITDAWSAFWREPGGAGLQCVSGSPEVVQALRIHWLAFAASLPPKAHVLDIGCGAGAAARALVAARHDIRVTGVDSARVPAANDPRIRLFSLTAMEALPFDDAAFDAAISQFGYEYGEPQDAALELTRVLAPGARFSFVVHHSESSILAANRTRLNLLATLEQPRVRAAFLSGDIPAFDAAMALVKQNYPDDRLAAELVRILPLRLRASVTDRLMAWRAIEVALAPEHRILEALDMSCVSPEELDGWLAPPRQHGAVALASTIRKPNGQAMAWRIDGECPSGDRSQQQKDSHLEVSSAGPF